MTQRRRRILVVEDSQVQALKLRHVLEAGGWDVVWAASAEAAMEELGRSAPDLVVLDFYLPGVRGDELCRRIRMNINTRAIPVIMLTAEGSAATELHGLESGADDFVAKSADPDILLLRIRGLLGAAGERSRLPGTVETSFRRARILSIDDSVTYLAYLAEQLGAEGYTVERAFDGKSALELLSRSAFDCVLVDLVMPGMDGIEVCRRINEMRRRTENPVAVLMLTGRENKEDLTRALEAGADDFVGKSSDMAVIKGRIRALLRRRFFQEENRRILEELKNKELERVRAEAERNAAESRAVAAEEIAKAREAAEQANRAKSEFLSRMSHELRTPLNSILGFGQLLEMESLSAEQRESVQQIVKGGRHLLELINEVLDIAGIEAGRMRLSLEEVRVADVVGEVTDMIEPLAAKAGVPIVASKAQTMDRVVRADYQRLKQVLLNLLSNAVKYNRPGGTVAVSCRELPADRLRIEVVDTGTGIAADKLGRLFTPFDRLGAEQTEIEGTGLGLALSKRLVEAMQGAFGAASEVGKGSTFWIELPLVLEPSMSGPTGAAEHAAPAVAAGRAAVVLYVEDNLANLRLFERIVAQRPHIKAISAMQGGMGLELARQHRPAVVFLDLNLPDISGYEVLTRLKAEPSTAALPVVVVSADATPGQIEKMTAAGAAAYLPKPIDVVEFLRVLDNLAMGATGD